MTKLKFSHLVRIPSNWHPNNEILDYIDSELNIEKRVSREQVEPFKQHYLTKKALASNWDYQFVSWMKEMSELNKKKDPDVFQSDRKRRVLISSDWLPVKQALEILDKQGVDPQFSQDCIREFILYWNERGEASDNWNTKFVSWVKRQWYRFKEGVQNSPEPSRIPDNWKPDTSVYEILNMAGINKEFITSLVGEFHLYWRDSNQLHVSWNSKFIQHCKQSWGLKAFQDGRVGAMSQKDYVATTTQAERVAATSWAKDL